MRRKMMKVVNVFIMLLVTWLAHGCQGAEKSTDKNQQGQVIIPGAWQTQQYFPLLEGKNIALVGNHSSLIGEVHLADSLLRAGFSLKKVFSPEHGFRGHAAAGEHVQDGIDTQTGLPVISLYGANRKPSPEDLDDIDLVIFDIQDVGVRFYTYISTMSYMMEAAAKLHIPMLILDRPNPNGHFVDGPILEPDLSSFVGLHPVPVVHGMTVGEYAQMVNGEGWLADNVQCSLKIIKVQNYERKMWYELPVPPSPNLPNMTSIMLYPSLCYFEGTVVSLGRGTDFPFQVYGHPLLPADHFPFSFTPEVRSAAPNPPLLAKRCNGIDLRTSVPEELQSIARLDLSHLLKAWNNFPQRAEFFNSFFDRLAGTTQLREQIISELTEEEIRASWQEGLTAFKKQRAEYLLYPDL